MAKQVNKDISSVLFLCFPLPIFKLFQHEFANKIKLMQVYTCSSRGQTTGLTRIEDGLRSIVLIDDTRWTKSKI